MSATTTKTPLTYGDALEMATGFCSAAGRLTHDERKCGGCAALVRAFMDIDQASRKQAREDVAAGLYPLSAPVDREKEIAEIVNAHAWAATVLILEQVGPRDPRATIAIKDRVKHALEGAIASALALPTLASSRGRA